VARLGQQVNIGIEEERTACYAIALFNPIFVNEKVYLSFRSPADGWTGSLSWTETHPDHQGET
jgi:hypothetical protein